MTAKRSRLPAVAPLSKILPPGTEGGKEFARIVDLLLFQDAQRRGAPFTIFSDAAGDYHGLDSFDGGPLRKLGTTGYQYKFYPCPLSAKHRADIEHSLRTVVEDQSELNIRKWILVTPDDFIESGVRADGGDVTWFQTLPRKTGCEFEIEHFGHSKLQSFFMQSESLALYYYPELVKSGPRRRKTLEATRSAYDENLRKSFGKIEFIGMSVYKEEAARGVAIEHIYIPLSAVSETADDSNEDVPRTDPLTFLRRGSKHVVLGDPGSGKSTLLSFLALVGISKPLQERCTAKPDDRLAVRVTLRRYADELKTRRNLSLIDYIVESTQADFNLKAADLDFFEFSLESGSAILLFDGLDELPSSQYKKVVRDRINTLCTTYPGNTTIVTSRIVGYEADLRFDDSEFRHFKLGRLRLSEIEAFISDWYTARIANENERNANVRDLIRIVSQPENVAIRDLSANPLLLTIIALVHRIDAVLPDERVVLYQKCTETLLNTWHKWKYREDEEQSKGKVERRNRRRIEGIAYWMQCRSTDAGQKRAIVPYGELKQFLSNFIQANEKPKPDEDVADDLADEFLTFVKRRTGLLIEVGDEKFSFVHLTFQEYLAATNLITDGEKEGVPAIWNRIADQVENPRWREVIRLLVASLKSDESKRYFIDRLLDPAGGSRAVARALLVGGFLIDGIESAEERSEEILAQVLASAADTDVPEDIRAIIATARTWAVKGAANVEAVIRAFAVQPRDVGLEVHLRRSLLGVAMGIPDAIEDLPRIARDERSQLAVNLALAMFTGGSTTGPVGARDDRAWYRMDVACSLLATNSPDTNFMAAVLAGLTIRCSKGFSWRRLFEQQLVVLGTGIGGPQSDLLYNMIIISLGAIRNRHPAIDRAVGTRKNRKLRIRVQGGKDANRQLRDFAKLVGSERMHRGLLLKKLADAAFKRPFLDDSFRSPQRMRDSDGLIRMNHATHVSRAREAAMRRSAELGAFWRAARSEPGLIEPVLSTFIAAFEIGPDTHWREALRLGPLAEVPSVLGRLFEPDLWATIKDKLGARSHGTEDAYSAAWLLLLDVWLYLQSGFTHPSDSPMKDIASRAATIPDGPIRLAYLVRGAFFNDESAKRDLIAMVSSRDPWVRETVTRCHWTE
jgi:hypothetical protein